MILTALTLFYLTIIFILVQGLRKLSRLRQPDQPTASIIVAVKNEARYIEKCICALLSQTYPPSLSEIILVDDGSTDSTTDILRKYAELYPRLTVIRSDETAVDLHSLSPESSSMQNISKSPLTMKKNALARGIERSSGEILLFTDADCIPFLSWAEEMIAGFEKDVGIVVGSSPLMDLRDSLLGKLIQFDSQVAAIIAAAGIGLNKPITCTGRNLAYRRVVYQQVNGFMEISKSLSGDDDLFLQLVRKTTNWKMKYMTSKQSMVPSFHSMTFRQFLKQKRRHLSAGKYYNRDLQFIYLIMFSVAPCLLISLFFTRHLLFTLVLLTGKGLADWHFIRRGAEKLNFDHMRFFPVWEIFHLIYHVLSAPLAFMGRIRWDK